MREERQLLHNIQIVADDEIPRDKVLCPQAAGKNFLRADLTGKSTVHFCELIRLYITSWL